MMKYYIKRCLGLPGDSLSIVNGYYRVNGIFEPVGNIEGQELFSVQSNKMLKDAGLYWSFPKDSLISWNVKNFGPLYLPRKGDVIDMNRENISIYRKLDVLSMLYQDASKFLLLFAFRVYNINPATVLAFEFTFEQSLHSTSADYTIGCIAFSCMFL